MNVIFLGPPGAGKGSVAAVIKERFSLLHFSTGDILRAEIKAATPLGLAAKSFIDSGKLVPDDVIIGMVEAKLAENKGGILFDGFPRTVAQAEALAKIAKIDAVIELDVPEDVIVARICSRRICSECGAVYNTAYYDKANCEKCGGKLYIRDDDNETTVRERYSVYVKNTAPLSDYYKAKGLLKSICGTDSIEGVADLVTAVLNEAKA